MCLHQQSFVDSSDVLTHIFQVCVNDTQEIGSDWVYPLNTKQNITQRCDLLPVYYADAIVMVLVKISKLKFYNFTKPRHRINLNNRINPGNPLKNGYSICLKFMKNHRCSYLSKLHSWSFFKLQFSKVSANERRRYIGGICCKRLVSRTRITDYISQ